MGVALVITGLMIGAMVYLVSQVRRDISEQYIFDARRATEEFLAMQRSITASVGLIRGWGESDGGEIIGIERAVLENVDKCRLHFKNLIATHIGAEISQYIRFRLVPVAGKTVGVIHCARSYDPVFLKNGNKEAFYIRKGLSSDELSVSKALKYIKQRK